MDDIAFVFKDLDGWGGADLKLTHELLLRSYNYHAVEVGAAYLGLYSGSLSFDTQSSLIEAYKKASASKAGIWSMDSTRRLVVGTLDDLGPERGALIYPKIFRRCVDPLRRAGGSLEPGSDLDDYLVERPSENDQLVVRPTYGRKLKSRLSDLLEQVNSQIKIEVDLNTLEFVSK